MKYNILFGVIIYEVSCMWSNKGWYKRKIARLEKDLEMERLSRTLAMEEAEAAYAMLTQEEKKQVKALYNANTQFYKLVDDKLA